MWQMPSAGRAMCQVLRGSGSQRNKSLFLEAQNALVALGSTRKSEEAWGSHCGGAGCQGLAGTPGGPAQHPSADLPCSTGISQLCLDHLCQVTCDPSQNFWGHLTSEAHRGTWAGCLGCLGSVQGPAPAQPPRANGTHLGASEEGVGSSDPQAHGCKSPCPGAL